MARHICTMATSLFEKEKLRLFLMIILKHLNPGFIAIHYVIAGRMKVSWIRVSLLSDANLVTLLLKMDIEIYWYQISTAHSIFCKYIYISTYHNMRHYTLSIYHFNIISIQNFYLIHSLTTNITYNLVDSLKCSDGWANLQFKIDIEKCVCLLKLQNLRMMIQKELHLITWFDKRKISAVLPEAKPWSF